MPACRRFYLSIILGFLFCGTKISAQTSKIINEDFQDVLFPVFVQKVEAITGCHFYFKPEELDSFHISVKAANTTLPDLLTKVFAHTAFLFAIDRENNVFINTKFAIQTNLPRDFFNTAKTNTDSADMIRQPFFEQADDRKKIVSQENKLYEIGSKQNYTGKEKATIAGYVRDSKSGESFTGAMVYTDTPYVAVVTDQFGFYNIALPRGRHVLQVNSLGMKHAKRQILLYSDGTLNIELQDSIPSLKNVTVIAEKKSNIRGLQMGAERLSIKTIKQVPVVFGEADVLKVLLTLPGVTSVGEASNGFNVRGGSTDQNLILFSDATIYNPSHLFGFFSAFNPDVVKGFDLYKSAIPEKYGGRLSSVLDVSMRDGNSKKVSGTGGIGLLTSKFTIEGPLQKDKTSFIAGGRTTYSNWLLKQIPKSDYSKSKAGFNDLNLRISHTIDTKNSLYLTGYISNDNFKLNTDTLYKYGNRNLNIKWKHNFTNKFYGVAVAGWDHYQYDISSDQNPVNAYSLKSSISQGSFRTDFNYSPNNKNAVSFGLNSIYYKIKPGAFKPDGQQSLVTPDVLQSEQALETALYLGDQYTISPEFSIHAGLRYSIYNYLGPRDVYSYVKGLPRDKTTLTDTTGFGKNKIIKTYHGPEYRFVARYALSNEASFKLSFNSLWQYIHMLSNTASISPSDIWKLSDAVIKPQRGYQLSLGYYKNFRSNTIETSLEIYYKKLKNYLDFKSGAVLLMNHQIETDVINTRGKAYGAELSIKKKSGKATGWFSYTYSKTLLQLDDPIAGQTINNGEYYPANFDKPHNVNLVTNYQFSHRFTTSLNIVYSTGRPITLPIAIYYLGGSQRVYYSERNQYRVPDYIRADFSVTLEGNHKTKKLTHNSWSFGVYNMLARQNPYSIYFVQEGGVIKGYQLSVFGTAIPFITYNFRF
jgi:CarboxypepD_reg-like domain/TonB-dependent Receptor Plug Domain